MESSHLLILDHSLERAIQLKNDILNAGIRVRILTAGTLYELECQLNDESPFLVLAASDALPADEAPTAVSILKSRNIPLVMRLEEGPPTFMHAALEQQSCRVIRAGHDEQLVDSIRRHQDGQSVANRARQSEDRAAELEQRAELLFRQSREAIAYLHQGLHVDANPAYLAMLQLEGPERLQGLSILELMEGVEFDLKTTFRELYQGRFPDSDLAVSIKNHLGESFLADASFQPVRVQQEDCVQVTVREVNQSARLQQAVEKQRSHDTLTGLLNRESFLSKLSDYLEDHEHRTASSALLYLQPDDFEEYQDTLGHAGADRFLAEFAATVGRCLSDADLACRFSDYGLAVLLRRHEHAPLDHIAQAMLDAAAEQAVTLEHMSLKTRCSIGMVAIGPAATSVDEIISHARMACRKAAETGHTLVRYKPRLSMVALDATSEAGWKERLRFGLDHGNFYSLQKSIVNLDEDRECYLESQTYLREDQNDIDAEEYLPAAEVCQVGAELDRAIIPGLLDTIARQQGACRYIVTITSNSMLDEGFTAWFAQALAERNLSGHRILLQMQAASAADHFSSALALTRELGQLGCGFVLSGFQNEPRHLKLLGELNASLVKLDHALAEQLLENEEQRQNVRSLVETAAGAGVNVMVDGIRDTRHMAALWQSGIKLVGGDFLQETPQVAGQA